MQKKTKVKVIKQSNTIEDIVPVMLDMGDKLTDSWEKSQDLKVAQTAIAAYNMAIKATAIQLINKKLTGMPKTIKALSK
jgi:hypothetical protein